MLYRAGFDAVFLRPCPRGILADFSSIPSIPVGPVDFDSVGMVQFANDGKHVSANKFIPGIAIYLKYRSDSPYTAANTEGEIQCQTKIAKRH